MKQRISGISLLQSISLFWSPNENGPTLPSPLYEYNKNNPGIKYTDKKREGVEQRHLRTAGRQIITFT
jgi:hypothetical protein